MPPGPGPSHRPPSGHRHTQRRAGPHPARLFRREDVKKTSRRITAAVSFRLLGPPMRIPDERERRVGQATRFEGGIVELMAAQQGAFRAQGMRLDEARLPVAEMQLAVRKTERRAKK